MLFSSLLMAQTCVAPTATRVEGAIGLAQPVMLVVAPALERSVGALDPAGQVVACVQGLESPAGATALACGRGGSPLTPPQQATVSSDLMAQLWVSPEETSLKSPEGAFSCWKALSPPQHSIAPSVVSAQLKSAPPVTWVKAPDGGVSRGAVVVAPAGEVARRVQRAAVRRADRDGRERARWRLHPRERRIARDDAPAVEVSGLRDAAAVELRRGHLDSSERDPGLRRVDEPVVLLGQFGVIAPALDGAVRRTARSRCTRPW